MQDSQFLPSSPASSAAFFLRTRLLNFFPRRSPKALLVLLLAFWTAQINAQTPCGNPDAGIWENTWQSCEPSPSPNPARGSSHWVLYDLGGVHRLSHTHIWNTNEDGKLDMGFRTVVVDYSRDKISWSQLGTYDFERGTGDAVYGGFDAFDFDGREARYILLTGLENWGNGDCFGIAEAKFNVWHDVPMEEGEDEDLEDGLENLEIFPNPAQTYAKVRLFAEGPQPVELRVSDLMGKVIYRTPYQLALGENTLSLNLDRLTPGLYLVTVVNTLSGNRQSRRLVVVKG